MRRVRIRKSRRSVLRAARPKKKVASAGCPDLKQRASSTRASANCASLVQLMWVTASAKPKHRRSSCGRGTPAHKATADGPIKKRGFFRSYSGLMDFLQAQIDACYYKTATEVIAIYIAAVEAWVEKLQAIAEILRVAAVRARNVIAKTQESMRTDPASVISASEIGRLPALLQAFMAERGESLPTASLKTIVMDNPASLLKEGAQQVAESLRRQLAGESVSSFCGVLKLQFDTELWFKRQLENLGGTSPLAAALIPQDEVEQTVVIAAGTDFALVERVLQENPRLGHQAGEGPRNGVGQPVGRAWVSSRTDRRDGLSRTCRASGGGVPPALPESRPGQKVAPGWSALETSLRALLPAHDAGFNRSGYLLQWGEDVRHDSLAERSQWFQESDGESRRFVTRQPTRQSLPRASRGRPPLFSPDGDHRKAAREDAPVRTAWKRVGAKPWPWRAALVSRNNTRC